MYVQNANVGSYSNEGFVEVLAATQSPISTSWFQVQRTDLGSAALHTSFRHVMLTSCDTGAA
jgi:hypothetical protein